MSIVACSVESCDRPLRKRGLCNMHYLRVKRTGLAGSAESLRPAREGVLTCTIDQCERPTVGRKMCGMHYQRVRTHGYLEKPSETFTCTHCGSMNTQDKRGPKPKYCSRECGYAGYRSETKDRINAEHRAANAAKPPVNNTCIQCGEGFESRHKKKKYCSSKCQNGWMDEHNPIRCAESDCDRGVRAKGLCRMHWRRKAREDGRETSEGWTERRKANYQKRRAQKLSLPSESVRPINVYERDGWVCGICSEPVDQKLSYPDPLSPSLDHVVPLSLGGHHVMENLALSHWICNVRKGNRIEADAMSA